jgi:hypothetical protein
MGGDTLARLYPILSVYLIVSLYDLIYSNDIRQSSDLLLFMVGPTFYDRHESHQSQTIN